MGFMMILIFGELFGEEELSIDEDLFLRIESLKGFGCGEGERKKVGGLESGEES